MKKKIKMLKPGTFRSKSGKVVNLTAGDLQATAAAYNPAVYPCPLVVGHPETDAAPSYGKLGACDFADGFLLGEPGRVAPVFVNVVNGGYFDHVSLSLFEPDSPANPVPGVYYPRHLAFLGAAAPAVPGLGTVSLSAEEGVISLSLDLGDWNDRTIAGMFRSLKNFLIGEFGQEKADKAINEWDVQDVITEAVKPEVKPGTCAACYMPCAECCCNEAPSTLEYSEQHKGGAMTLTAAQLATKETELNQREASLKILESGKKHTANLDFAEGLVKEGKLLPANKAAVVAVLDFAEGITQGDTIEFGEGEAKKTLAPAQILQDILKSYPKIIEFAELVTGGDPVKQGKAIPADITKYV